MSSMAPDAPKSSQKVKNVVLGVLALWSIVSLVVIVVWATSPDLKGSAQCRADLQEATEKLEGAKVVWNKNKVALEELLEAERQEGEQLKLQVLLLQGQLKATNVTLDECQQEQVILNRNISVLLKNIEELRQTESNLTAQLLLQEENVEALQQNVTQTFLQTLSCINLKAAAESQMVAAQSETRACESRQQYLHKQLQKCRDVEESSAPQQTASKQGATIRPPSNIAAALSLSVPLLTLMVCGVLRLIT